MSYVEDRIEHAVRLKEEVRQEFNDCLDDIFAKLNLKKNEK